MTLAAGSLRHRIEIHELVSVLDEASGNREQTWPLFADAWASVRPETAREFMAAGGEQTKVEVIVIIRYIPGIKRSMRIRHGDRLLNINSAEPDPDSGREFLRLLCSEVVSG